MEKTKGRNIRNDTPLSTYDSSDWAELKRRLPMYFWPQILLENIIINSSKRQKDRIKTVLKQMKKMEKKNPLYDKIDKIMADYYKNQQHQIKKNKNKK